MSKTRRVNTKRKRSNTHKHRVYHGRKRSKTSRKRQRGGKTNERDCILRSKEKSSENWKWVRGAKHRSFDDTSGSYFQCDLSPRGGCCRKVKSDETECSICLQQVKTCEMEGKSDCKHKVCKECYLQFPANANCPQCRKPGFTPQPYRPPPLELGNNDIYNDPYHSPYSPHSPGSPSYIYGMAYSPPYSPHSPLESPPYSPHSPV
jgi:hypothetical protein